MELLSVKDLCKDYESFHLKNVSFSLDQGYIMGFIGRNGAGKTTTLKSMLGLVHPTSGEVTMFGKNFFEEEFYCKQRIGSAFGGVDYYPQQKLSDVTAVYRRFYEEWDDAAYRAYLERFELDEKKRIRQLSAGMKVKYSLALALSHQAKLLLLDEPTSGLDPVSRDDLVELFQEIIEDGQRSILFSTHITSDLEKCADYITYIKNGEIVSSTDRESFLGAYRLVRGRADQLTPELEQKLVGVRTHAFGFTALVHTGELPACGALETAPADLESIMVHCDKE